MTWGKHAALGAAVGALSGLAPDAALALFGWRSRWLPERHALVRLHRALHDPRLLAFTAAAAGYASHVIADQLSTHRDGPA